MMEDSGVSSGNLCRETAIVGKEQKWSLEWCEIPVVCPADRNCGGE